MPRAGGPPGGSAAPHARPPCPFSGAAAAAATRRSRALGGHPRGAIQPRRSRRSCAPPARPPRRAPLPSSGAGSLRRRCCALAAAAPALLPPRRPLPARPQVLGRRTLTRQTGTRRRPPPLASLGVFVSPLLPARGCDPQASPLLPAAGPCTLIDETKVVSPSFPPPPPRTAPCLLGCISGLVLQGSTCAFPLPLPLAGLRWRHSGLKGRGGHVVPAHAGAPQAGSLLLFAGG